MSDYKLYDHAVVALNVADYRFAIVAARFNQEIVDSLMHGAITTLQQSGANENQIIVARVPGAFEIPLLCQRLAAGGEVDALIALGCVIRGDTPHFDYICTESARGVMEVGLKYDIPVINGILTVDNPEQAKARAQINGNNKGADAASAAIEMLTLLAEL
ncbi:MAG: 6,7-dimethyl-8-ribityllumazine synthase [Gammaproteobacteria bacterium]|nr:6,7-dimethyl-8-ribityllumazine synthase [Gammaproteobacteria bacterium]